MLCKVTYLVEPTYLLLYMEEEKEQEGYRLLALLRIILPIKLQSFIIYKYYTYIIYKSVYKAVTIRLFIDNYLYQLRNQI